MSATAAEAAAAPQAAAQLVQVRIAEAVMGAALATILAGYLGIDVGPDLKRWATDVLVPHRARLVREAGLGPADIVLYQRSGERIRQVVADKLIEALARGGPVIALGNSLGGIILVDLLAQPDSPKPQLLTTVGSQAPLLATFGALAPIEKDLGPKTVPAVAEHLRPARPDRFRCGPRLARRNGHNRCCGRPWRGLSRCPRRCLLE